MSFWSNPGLFLAQSFEHFFEVWSTNKSLTDKTTLDILHNSRIGLKIVLGLLPRALSAFCDQTLFCFSSSVFSFFSSSRARSGFRYRWRWLSVCDVLNGNGVITNNVLLKGCFQHSRGLQGSLSCIICSFLSLCVAK